MLSIPNTQTTERASGVPLSSAANPEKTADFVSVLKDVYVVLPSLDPDPRMPETVTSMLDAGFSNVLVINDGSRPENVHFFEEVAALPGVTVLTHEVNMGKGVALRTAFRWLLSNVPTCKGCVTVDGDAQHSAPDTRETALKMLETNHITLGCRDFDDPSVPSRNRFGNKTTRLVFRLLIGMKITDTQTGLRAFPKDRFEWLLGVEGDRFEYESNMLLDMHEQAVPFEEVMIQTIYIGGNASSHFHPIRDSYKVYKPILKRARNAKFLVGSLGSALIDVGAFTLLNLLLRALGVVGEETVLFGGSADWTRIAVATVFARIISSLFNYHWNRNAVFRSTERKRQTMVRYYILAIVQIYLASVLLTVLSRAFLATGFGETLLKAAVDLFLFFGSYQIQKRWVFGVSANKKDAR